MNKRVVWYALGGGLGHLNRVLAVLRHLRPRAREASHLLITNTPYVSLALAAGVPTLRVPGTAEASQFPKGAASELVASALATLAPLDLLVVDTFADGLHGELTPEVLALARHRALLYREGGVQPEHSAAWSAYQTILAPYPVSPHPDALPVGTIVNRAPGEVLAPEDARARLGLNAEEAPVILAVHAGDPGEVLAFFAQVRAACRHLERPYALRLLTPLPLPGEHWPEVVHLYPASEVLSAADLVIAGAGYNTHAELSLFGKRALYRPFDRSHDVQPARLGGEEQVFGALTDPVLLAEMMRQALDGPPPRRDDARDYDGARTTAEVLLGLLS